MVELYVLADGDRLLVAHDPGDLAHPRPIAFADALAALAVQLPEHVRVDVDIKATGYEAQVVAAIRESGLTPRTLISTMELFSLAAIRALAPELPLGLSVPKARRDYLGSRLMRPGAYAMLAYLRLVLPRRVAGILRAGRADAIMAHWGVVTPALVRAVRGRGAELYVWTVDDPGRLVTLAGLGVTGVITNERDLFARAGLSG